MNELKELLEKLRVAKRAYNLTLQYDYVPSKERHPAEPDFECIGIYDGYSMSNMEDKIMRIVDEILKLNLDAPF